jgi:hypothetical protein
VKVSVEISGSTFNSVTASPGGATKTETNTAYNQWDDGDTCDGAGKPLKTQMAQYSANASELSFQLTLQGGAVLRQVYTKVP